MNTEKKPASVSWVLHDAEFNGWRETRDERNRPKGPDLCQPRATPWESDSKGTPSPKRGGPKRIANHPTTNNTAPLGLPTFFCKPLHGALPQADIGLARWAGNPSP